MRKITALQDVSYRENWFPRGTGFVVVERPKAGAKPPQVDPRTADAWERQSWAEAVTGKDGHSDAG